MSDENLDSYPRLRILASDLLAAYKSGEISLRRLIDGLNAVWCDVSQSDWADDFRGHWWTLEQVYAVATDRGQLDSMPSEFIAAIDEAVGCLESLVDSWPEPAGYSASRQEE